MGWPVYLLAVAGLVRGLWRRRPADLALAGFVVAHCLVLVSARQLYPRYMLPLVPVAAAVAAMTLWHVVASSRGYVQAVAVALVMASGLSSSVRFDRLAAERDTRLVAIDWLGENVAPRTKIAVCGGYGAPRINRDRRRPPAFEPIEVSCNPDAIQGAGAPYLITHAYPPLGQHPGSELRDFLESSARPLHIVDPLRPVEGAAPFFFQDDVFYLPFTRFAALSRGGPIVTIWAID